MAEQEMLPVEQCDREAAVRLTQDIGARTRGEGSAMLNGYADDDCYVQAFARHRLAATKAADERVAKFEQVLRRIAQGETVILSDGFEAKSPLRSRFAQELARAALAEAGGRHG